MKRRGFIRALVAAPLLMLLPRQPEQRWTYYSAYTDDANVQRFVIGGRRGVWGHGDIEVGKKLFDRPMRGG